MVLPALWGSEKPWLLRHASSGDRCHLALLHSSSVSCGCGAKNQPQPTGALAGRAVCTSPASLSSYFFFLPALSHGGEQRCEAFAAFVCSVVPCGEDGGCGGGSCCQPSCPRGRGSSSHGLEWNPHVLPAPEVPLPALILVSNSRGLAALPCSQTLLPAWEGIIGERSSDFRAVPRELLAALWWQTGLAAVPAARSCGGWVPPDSILLPWCVISWADPEADWAVWLCST